MTQNDLLQKAYLKMVSKSDKDGNCAISFWDLAHWLNIEQKDAIEAINQLVALGKIEFLGATHWLGGGDYLCQYIVRKW